MDNRKAKNAVMTGVNKPFEVRTYAVLPPPTGMARMKLLSSGVCGTDVHLYTGRLGVGTPTCLGHEFVGEVEDISKEDSERTGIAKGDNVIVDIAVPCGKCVLCLQGDDANCVNMGVTNGFSPDEAPYFYGGFGSYNYTRVENLVKIPSSLDPVAVSVFACPGPTVIHGYRLGVKAGLDLDKVKVAVVQGAGPVGCFAVAFLANAGAEKVIAVCRKNDAKRNELLKKLGAAEVLCTEDIGDEGALRKIAAENGGLGADLVFEASGNPKAVPQGLDMLRNRGMYIIPGQYSESGGVTIQPQIITFKALNIVGSSQYSMVDVRDYVEFMTEHPVIASTAKDLATPYGVSDVNRAFSDAIAGKNIKTVIVPDQV